MSLAYSSYYKELECLIQEAVQLVAESNPPNRNSLKEQLAAVRSRTATEAPLRLAIIGEFSAGKSSLIRALTGADVAIDADVCTSSTEEFSWQGLTLVDTPGIQAEGSDTDHDRIARAATVGADLVLFVITNELFNPRLAAHLRFILDDTGLGLAKKTALIVNKIDRESNPDEILLGQIQMVLGPHQNVPIYFCAASKLLQAETAPPELSPRFIRQSRVSELIQGIDQFVDDAGTYGRLATPLQVVAEITDALQIAATSNNDDKNQVELVRRQRVVLQGLQQRLLEIRKTWKQQAYSAILRQTEPSVSQIEEFCTEDDLARLFESGLMRAVGEVDSLYDGVEADLREALDAAQQKLDEIGQSPLAQDVERAAAKKAEKVNIGFGGEKPGGQPILAKFVRTGATPLKEGLEAAAKNAGELKKIVLSVGKAFGKKFRPWGATKAGNTLAKWAGGASKAVPFLAAALDYYVQYREEKAKEEKARYLASLRLSLRNAFAEQAKVEGEALESGIIQVSKGPIAKALADLDALAAQITEADSKNAALSKRIADLRDSCTRLRTLIMGGIQRELAAN